MVSREIAGKLPFWEKLSERERQTVQENAVLRHFEKGQMLRTADTGCLGMIMVQSGSLRICSISEEGREITLFRLSMGETCVLSASCVVEAITFETQMIATEDCELAVIQTFILEELAERNVYVRCFMYEVLCKRFSSVMWTMQMILFKRYDRRLAEFLASEYERTGLTEIRMTHEQIAQHTNSAREVVARMLKRFAADGLVSLKRGVIRLNDIEGLQNLR